MYYRERVLLCTAFDLGFRNNRKLRISGPMSCSLGPCVYVCVLYTITREESAREHDIIHTHTHTRACVTVKLCARDPIRGVGTD